MASWESGSGDNDTFVGQSELPNVTIVTDELVPIELWLVYSVAAAVVLLASVVFVVIVILLRFIFSRRRWRKTGRCRFKRDELDGAVEKTIEELFQILDKRNGVIKEDEPPETSENQVSLTVDSLVILNTQPDSPRDSVKSNRNSVTSATSPKIDTLQLKPLAEVPLSFSNPDSIYDELEKSVYDRLEVEGKVIEKKVDPKTEKEEDAAKLGSPQDIIYDDAISPSHRKALVGEIEHSYIIGSQGRQDRVFSDGARSSHTQNGSKKEHFSFDSAEHLYSTVDNEPDKEGVYTIPDSLPQKKDPTQYSYASQHQLVVSPKKTGISGEGEVRATSTSRTSLPRETSSMYTQVDDLQSNRNSCSYTEIDDFELGKVKSSYSNIDEEEGKYSYAATHSLVSPTTVVGHSTFTTSKSKDATMSQRLQDHHPIDPKEKSKSLQNAFKGKSNSLQRIYSTPFSSHTYGNVQSELMSLPTTMTTAVTQESKNEEESVCSTLPPEKDGSSNPLYINSTHLSEGENDADNPGLITTKEGEERSKESDYLSDCKDWLPKGHSPHVIRPKSTAADHTYMGILVRDRVDNDYAMPKPRSTRLLSLTKGSQIQDNVLLQRTFSLDEKNHKYENQAMWLKENPKKKKQMTTCETVHNENYMKLLESGFAYEEFYSRPSQHCHSQHS